MSYGSIGRFGEFMIIEDRRLTKQVEDWSRVRSPGRAARRRKKHRQNIVMREVPSGDVVRMGDRLFMHPETAKELRRKIAEQGQG